jgi:pyruvate dehydrogenase E2 component (dihydrolipoamide acetyltransferase)
MADIRPFCMPKWGIEMTEGTIAEWMVKEGDAFTRGQTLCLIETAKITNEVDAEYADGRFVRLIAAGGPDLSGRRAARGAV